MSLVFNHCHFYPLGLTQKLCFRPCWCRQLQTKFDSWVLHQTKGSCRASPSTEVSWSDTRTACTTAVAWCRCDIIPFHSQELASCLKSDVSCLLSRDLEWLCESSCHDGVLTRLVSLMPDPSATKSCRARGLTPPQLPLSGTVLSLRRPISKHKGHSSLTKC